MWECLKVPNIEVREDRGTSYDLLFRHDVHISDNSELRTYVYGLAAHLPLKRPTELSKQNAEFYLAWLLFTHVP